MEPTNASWVSCDTPLFLKRIDNAEITYMRIDELHADSDAASKYLVWGSENWQPLYGVFAKKNNVPLVRVVTSTSLVDVLADSWFFEDDEAKTPVHCSKVLRKKLFHNPIEKKFQTKDYSEFLNSLKDIREEPCLQCKKAWVYGFFFADGSTSEGLQKNGSLFYRWKIYKNDPEILKVAQKQLDEVYKDSFMKFKIGFFKRKNSETLFGEIRPAKDHRFMYYEYRHLFYNSFAHKIVPQEVLNHESDKHANYFCKGYYQGDGTKCNLKSKQLEFDNQSKHGTNMLLHMFNRIGFNHSLNYRKDEERQHMLKAKLSNKPRNVHVAKIATKISRHASDDNVFSVHTTGDFCSFNLVMKHYNPEAG